VRDQSVATALDAVLIAAKTGRRGDGKVFVMPVESACRIRTGETNTQAV
jgi:nitrogen regulatory protein PII